MTHHKSAIKAHKQSLKKSLRNKVIKSKIKTFMKKVENFVKIKDIAGSILALRKAESIIMKAVNKKVLKLNNASRKVKGLVCKIKSLELIK
jgi:small subunit ribosomal protein S20